MKVLGVLRTGSVVGLIVALLLVLTPPVGAQGVEDGAPAEEAESLWTNATPNIVGGTLASIADHPWIVNLDVFVGDPASPAEFECGGTILRSEWVLTAAHCIDGAFAVTVKAGSANIATPAQTIQVADWIIHTNWDTNRRGGVGNAYDVALLQLATPLNFNSNVQPIPVATRPELASTTTRVIAGWGTTGPGGSGSLSPLLREASVISYTDAFCESFWDGAVAFSRNREVCAGVLDVSTCGGDSGGPLTVPTPNGPKLAGVTSWGPVNCGAAPAVYADPFFFSRWLFDNLPKLTCGGQEATIDFGLGMSANGQANVIVGTDRDDRINAKAGADLVCAGDGDDYVLGAGGHDDIRGEAGNDVLKGNSGIDRISGSGGRDSLFGGTANDELLGGGAVDELNGGKGIDDCIGNGGNDTFTASCENQVQ